MDKIIINNLINSLKICQGQIEHIEGGEIKKVRISEIHDLVVNCAKNIISKGVKAQDTVGVFATNTLDYVILDLSLIAIGAIQIPLDTVSDAERLLNTIQPSLVITTGSENSYRLNYTCIPSYQLFVNSSDSPQPPFKPYHFSNKDALAVKFTSGSTGEPKAMHASVTSVSDTIEVIQEMFQHNHYDKMLIFIPLSIIQQRYWIYSSILFNFQISICSHFFALKMIKHCQPSVIMGVPEFYNSIKKHCEVNDVSVKSILGDNIRYLWTGSAALNKDVIEFFFNQGTPVFQGYGTNELCIVAKNTFSHSKIGSSGRILKNKEVRISEIGEILVKPKYPVCNQYLNSNSYFKIEHTKEGFVRTGDIGYLDEDGYLYITGKLQDDIVLNNGRTIRPLSTENELNSERSIRFSLLFGNNKPYVVALIVTTNDADEESIVNAVNGINEKLDPRDKIRKYYSVRESNFNSSVLVSAQGKPKRRKIYRTYQTELENLYT